jgi:O-antigen/teichoic acid export membrane protein
MNRTKNTFKNTLIGIGSQIILLFTNFFTRYYFINFVGIESLGLKTFLISITILLNLSELGISSTLMFSLYGYIKDQNINAIKSIMIFTTKIFRLIGLFILIIGVLFAFFIVDIVKSKDFSSSFIIGIYLIQIVISSLNYLFLHKRIFINANQLNYVIIIIDTFSNVIFSIVNIFLLSIFKDFLLFSIISAANMLISNILINIFYNVKFKKINNFKGNLNKEYYSLFLKNIPYSLLIKFGGFIYFFMDSLIINHFLGLTIIGILSNYQLIITSVKAFLGSFNSALMPSLGNFLLGTENKDNVVTLFKKINFLFIFLGSSLSIGFALLINPFIDLWLGPGYTLSNINVFLIAIVFFYDQISTSLWHFLNSAGKFKNESFSSTIASIIKFITSIALVNFIGISGIFLSTILSNSIYFFNRTKYLNNNFFKFNKYNYLKELLIQVIFAFIQFFILSIIISQFDLSNWFNFIFALLGVSLILLISNFIFYKNNNELRFYYLTIRKILSPK